jgi:hypothetical protein
MEARKKPSSAATNMALKVTLLEAGKPQSDAHFTEHKPEFELTAKSRLAGKQEVISIFLICRHASAEFKGISRTR